MGQMQSRDVLGEDRVLSAPCSGSTHHSTQPCTSCLHLLPNLPFAWGQLLRSGRWDVS